MNVNSNFQNVETLIADKIYLTTNGSPTPTPTPTPTTVGNHAPTVSPISANIPDADTSTAGYQVATGSVVTYSATASDPDGNPITWNSYYTVNGGTRLSYASGSGNPTSVTYSYGGVPAGNTYQWILSVSDGLLTTESSLTVSIINGTSPTPTPTITPTPTPTITPPPTITPTPTPTPTSTPTPPTPSSKFVLGDRVEVVTGTLNVRSCASTSCALRGSQAVGAQGTVVGGPTYSDGYWWWNVNYDSGADGWSVEDNLQKAIAPSPTPTPSPTPVTSKFQINDRVKVTQNLKVRSCASTSCKQLGIQKTNAQGTVIGGPTAANGYIWWNINYDTGVDGWSAQDWLMKI